MLLMIMMKKICIRSDHSRPKVIIINNLKIKRTVDLDLKNSRKNKENALNN